VENPERRSGTIWVLFEKHSSYFDPDGNKIEFWEPPKPAG
jgi:hypothetical protein